MGKYYIFGHKYPDTDSICSSIAYAELKRQLGFKDAKAYRLGNLNKETKFALDYFNIEEPEILSDVKVKIEDIEIYKPVTLSENDPIKLAWDNLNERVGRLVPVLAEDGSLTGIISLGDITKIFMGAILEDSKPVYEILFKNLLKILEAKLVFGSYNYEKLEGNLYIGSSAIYSHEEITDKDIVITAKIDTARKCALDLKCGCVIIVNNQIPDGLEDSEAGIVVVRKNIYDTIGLINQAISIKSILRKENITAFSTDSYIEDITDIMRTSIHRNFPVLDTDGKFYGVISRRHLMEFHKKQVILIDHNEKTQSVDGLEQASIVEIIDHHRVADIQTEAPLFVRSEPLGSTATIITKMFHQNNLYIKKEIAGILLSAIISDTLMFTSPTCTNEDRVYAEKLAQIAEVSLEKYGRELFTAGTSLEGYSSLEILGIDRKKFTIGRYSASIAQVNTLDFRSILNQKDELLEAMEQYKTEYKNDLVILMITDIVNTGSEILVVGSNKARELMTAAFGLDRNDNSIYLDGVVSRKKQMIPKLTAAATAF